MSANHLTSHIEMIKHEQDAAEISEFLLSEYSFDDQNHTPGEFDHFRHHPNKSLKLERYHYWYIRNDAHAIIGVISGYENEQRTGGYVIDYIVVHKDYRHQGLATQLIVHMLEYVKANGGRYIITYTCDLDYYYPIQQLFGYLGFQRIGFYPDYYYEGEGRITFYCKL